MQLTTLRRPLTLGLALAGAVALGGGATAVVNARAATPGTHTQQVVRQVAEPSATTPTPAVSSPATARPTVTSTAAQSGAAVVRPVTLAQAVALATSRTHARLDNVESETGPAGLDYDVKLVRPDGTEVEVVVAARTGQIVAGDPADAADTPDAADSPDPADGSASDQAGEAPDGSDG